MPSTPPVRRAPAGRYGPDRRARRRPRWLVPVALALAVAATAGLYLVLRGAGPQVAAGVAGFTVRGPRSLRVMVAVQHPAGRAAQCRVVAYAVDHAVVGTSTVRVAAASPPSTTVATVVATSTAATSADVTGCRLLASER